MSFKDFVGLNTVTQSLDYAEMQVDFNDDLKNIYGYYHGGVYFALADHTAGMAAISNGDAYVTAAANINYMVAVNEGKLTAKAKVINRSGKLAIVDVSVYNENDVLVNTCTFTMYKINV